MHPIFKRQYLDYRIVVVEQVRFIYVSILYQGPKIWNSLPVTIASLSSFHNFKTARVFSKIVTELAKPHTVALFM